jgi:hypothetical protein
MRKVMFEENKDEFLVYRKKIRKFEKLFLHARASCKLLQMIRVSESSDDSFLHATLLQNCCSSAPPINPKKSSSSTKADYRSWNLSTKLRRSCSTYRNPSKNCSTPRNRGVENATFPPTRFKPL